MSLFNDPVGWIRSGLGSPIRLGGLIGVQLSTGIALVLKNDTRYLSFFVFCSIFPCMFYYAAYRLLILYDAKVGKPPQQRTGSDWLVLLIDTLAGLLILIFGGIIN